MSTKNGGPAFPYITRFSTDSRSHGGMTLRDYFAAKAMQGWMSNSDVLKQLPDGREAHFIAKMSFELADAMIFLREGGDK